MNEIKNLRLAVLIDADNVPHSSMKAIMEEAAIYGTPTIKRIYGDWTSPNIGAWKSALLENAVTPIQQYAYTTGKNSTDSAMIIDAMDILYEGKTDGFCIVSSDSDFTRLAIRLREAGMRVIGMGEKKTPVSFRVACDKFIYIEVIRAAAQDRQKASQPAKASVSKQSKQEAAKQEAAKQEAAKQEAAKQEAAKQDAAKQDAPQKSSRRRSRGGRGQHEADKPAVPEAVLPEAAPAEIAPPEPVLPEPERSPMPEAIPPAALLPEPEPSGNGKKEQRVPEETVKLIVDSVSDIADEDGYAFMGELGNLLLKKQPDFDPRNFGFTKLTQLIRSLSRFEIDARVTDATKTKHIYLRDKEA